jgi:predicted nucleotidyltransferase
MGVATIKRELDRMTGAGILTLKKIGNQHHYQANPECPVYQELVSITAKILGNDEMAITDRYKITQSALSRLARRYHIQRLSVFGSAARGQMDENSDIDLLVEFEEGRAPSLGGMVRIKDDFSALFEGRKVDIVTPSILNNPYRRRAIEKELKELYAA